MLSRVRAWNLTVLATVLPDAMYSYSTALLVTWLKQLGHTLLQAATVVWMVELKALGVDPELASLGKALPLPSWFLFRDSSRDKRRAVSQSPVLPASWGRDKASAAMQRTACVIAPQA